MNWTTNTPIFNAFHSCPSSLLAFGDLIKITTLRKTIVKRQVVFKPQITLIRASSLRCRKNVKLVECMRQYTHFKIDIFQPAMLLATGWATNGIFQPRVLSDVGWVNIVLSPKYAANFSFIARFILTPQNRELPVSGSAGKSYSREVRRPKFQANCSPPSVAENKSVSNLFTNPSRTCVNGMTL